MEFFKRAKVFRLKCGHHNKYLSADEDEETIKQSSKDSSPNTLWTYELSESNSNIVRFRNKKTSKYLATTDVAFLTGMTGKRVAQRMRLDSTVEWEPIKEGQYIKLKSSAGTLLRANPWFPPWSNSVTHDEAGHWTASENMVLWIVDIVDLDLSNRGHINNTSDDLDKAHSAPPEVVKHAIDDPSSSIRKFGSGPPAVTEDDFTYGYRPKAKKSSSGRKPQPLRPGLADELLERRNSGSDGANERRNSGSNRGSGRRNSVLDGANEPRNSVSSGDNERRSSVSDGFNERRNSVSDGTNERKKSTLDAANERRNSGIDRAKEHRNSGIERAKEHRNSEIDRAKEQRISEIDRAKEHRNSGIDRAKEHRNSGIDRAKEHRNPGLDGANERRNSRSDKVSNGPSFESMTGLAVNVAKLTFKELKDMEFHEVLSSGQLKKLETAINVLVGDAKVSGGGNIPREFGNLQGRLKTMKKDHEKATQELQDCTAFSSSRYEARAEQQKIDSQMHELEAVKFKLRNSLATAKAKREELLKEIKEIENSINNAEESLAGYEEEVQEVVSRIEQKSKALKVMEREQRSWKLKKNEADRTLERLEEEWIEVKDVLAAFQ